MTTNELVDVSTAVAALAAAWNPPLPAVNADAEDDLWDGDDCGCAGEDSSGRPWCNCGDGCSCEHCNHFHHKRRRTCGVLTCGATSRMQVKAWSVAHHSVQARQIDPSLTSETGGDEWVDLDDIPSYTWSVTACGYGHAKQLVNDDSSQRNDQRPPENRLRYEITAYEYEPHRLDLPEILDELREVGRSIEYNTRALAKAGCRFTGGSAVNPDVRLAEARRQAAKLVAMLTELSTHGDRVHTSREEA